MKLTDWLNNISGLAAIAIILLGGVGFLAVIIAAVTNRPMTAEALALVDRFINILIGLAVGAGAGGSALAGRAVRAMEVQNENMQAQLQSMQAAQQMQMASASHSYPPPPPKVRNEP